jgi:hypothetical protein
MSPNSSVLSYEQEDWYNHFRLIQEFFSILVNDASAVGPVLVKLFVAFDLDTESTTKQPGGFRILSFKAGGFFNHQAMWWTILSGQNTNDYGN